MRSRTEVSEDIHRAFTVEDEAEGQAIILQIVLEYVLDIRDILAKLSGARYV